MCTDILMGNTRRHDILNFFVFGYFSVQVVGLFVCAGQNAVCLDVNQDGTSRNCCTQRLVILHAQTY